MIRLFLIYLSICIIISVAATARAAQDPMPPDDSAAPARETPPAARTDKSASPFAQVQFIPDLSLIADFSCLYRSLGNETYRSLVVPGIPYHKKILGWDLWGQEYLMAPESAHEGHGHAVTRRGFNFNYGELVLSAAVDPYFDLMGVFHAAEHGFAVEEAHVTTRRLPGGFHVRGGIFKSNFGRINEQHAHQWDFADLPLVHRLFLGDEGLNDKGIRITCLLPTPWYLLLGAEVFQGDNETSFGTEGFKLLEFIPVVREAPFPGCYTGTVKTSIDAGKATILAGASYAGGTARINLGIDEAELWGEFIAGDTRLLGVDCTIRYSFDARRNVSLQAEYLYRHLDGTRYDRDLLDLSSVYRLKMRQGGGYVQVAATVAEHWRVACRYDHFADNRIHLNGAPSLPALAAQGDTEKAIKLLVLQTRNMPQGLYRVSTMTEWAPTEFSRLRLQYAYDRSRFREKNAYHRVRRPIHDVQLQATMAIGAHGAHAF